MYIYNQNDQWLVDQRVAQYRDQTRRYLAGQLGEDEFRTLRLMNGLYIQTHGPMLRIAVPYGLLSSNQVRMLAYIARKYDRGFGHFTTRQNIQFNWVKLEEVPDILADLASVQMHAIQTSGNCIRNVTCDPLAGVCADEIEDPRPWCELVRQWSTFHPEFTYLPRKFKIAFSAAPVDRAATRFHDIGLQLVKNESGETGFQVWVGGGLGRTPLIAELVRAFVPADQLLSYLEAILRHYNLMGRRDNMYKSRIKILLQAQGVDTFREHVEALWQPRSNAEMMALDDNFQHRITTCFDPPPYQSPAPEDEAKIAQQVADDARFGRWVKHNTAQHKISGYRVVYISLKASGEAPGDITHEQMDAVADLADQYSFGRIRSTKDQNLMLADVAVGHLYELWRQMDQLKLATPNINTLNDLVCCPGLDYCSLANSASIGVARQIHERFDDLDYLYDLGPISLKLSGCMNACGHHHIADIGLLGVDKKGQEFYQVTLGGSSGWDGRVGKVVGPSFAADDVVDSIERILEIYVEERLSEETFQDTFSRLGIKPFKEKLYANHPSTAHS